MTGSPRQSIGSHILCVKRVANYYYYPESGAHVYDRFYARVRFVSRVVFK